MKQRKNKNDPMMEEDDKLISTAIMKSILYLLFSFFERDICIEMYRSFRLGSIPYQCMYNVHMCKRPPMFSFFMLL